MQRVKDRFHNPDGKRYGSLQSCIRTNDLELVGDGSHLTYFEMVGTFGFGDNDYETSVQLWHSILYDLNIRVTEVRVHPSRPDHKELWTGRGYNVIEDDSCSWSDGNISGECCELFCGNLEIGNLVNPLGNSTDVGFGWERLHQIVEGKHRVDETSLFQGGHPIVSDHCRTLQVLYENGIEPGNKGRNYVCRRLIRRILPLLSGQSTVFDEWIEQESLLRERCLKTGRRKWRKYSDKPPEWWWETFGILPDEMPLLGKNMYQK